MRRKSLSPSYQHNASFNFEELPENDKKESENPLQSTHINQRNVESHYSVGIQNSHLTTTTAAAGSTVLASTVLMNKIMVESTLNSNDTHLNTCYQQFHQQLQQQQSYIQHHQDDNQLQQQQHNGGKRDILLKIRQQIFERKRQRQLALHLHQQQEQHHHHHHHHQQQQCVWRPW